MSLFRYVLFDDGSGEHNIYTCPVGCEKQLIDRKMESAHSIDNPNGTHVPWTVSDVSEESFLTAGDAKRAGKNRSQEIRLGIPRKEKRVSLYVHAFCSAFEPIAVGSRIIGGSHAKVLEMIEQAIAEHDPSHDLRPGQLSLCLPEEANGLVLCGVGRKTKFSHDYHVKMHRGAPTLCLNREHSLPTEWVHATVYTKAAMLEDPQIDEQDHKMLDVHTHCLVSLRAGVGEDDPLTMYRFVSNLAGGNLNVQDMTLAQIQQTAKEVLAGDEFCVVSD
jgi:hypothetical protein